MTTVMQAGDLAFTIENVPANRLEIDPAVQRAVTEARIVKIAKNFAEERVGILTVSRRTGGRMVVLDGQTRLFAARRVAGSEDTAMLLLCQVYQGLHRKDEAELFLSHNDRNAVKPIDRYRVALVAEEEWAKDIFAVTDRHGFAVDINAPIGKRCTALAALERIYRAPDGLDALDRALDTIVCAWGHRPAAAANEIVTGLGLLYLRHPGQVDHKGLAAKLASEGDPHQFVGKVAQFRHAVGVSVADAAYRHAVRVHDKGLKTRRIGSSS